MREITSREFLLKTSKYLRDIPFVVTKRGVPTFKVVPIGTEVKGTENVVTMSNVVTNNVATKSNVVTSKKTVPCKFIGCSKFSNFYNIEKDGEKAYSCADHKNNYIRLLKWSETHEEV